MPPQIPVRLLSDESFTAIVVGKRVVFCSEEEDSDWLELIRLTVQTLLAAGIDKQAIAVSYCDDVLQYLLDDDELDAEILQSILNRDAELSDFEFQPFPGHATQYIGLAP